MGGIDARKALSSMFLRSSGLSFGVRSGVSNGIPDAKMVVLKVAGVGV